MSGFLSGRTSLTTVQTADLANDAVTEAKVATDAISLTELKAGTDGELITWDASGDPAFVSTGTATHVLTSNGAGAAPTFQAAAGGEWVRVSQTAVSSDVSDVDFTGLIDDNTVYAFYLEAIGADVYNGASDLCVRFGDSTPTYQSSGYLNVMRQHYTSGSSGYDTATTGVTLSDGTDADGEGVTGWVYCMNMANASLKPRCIGHTSWENQTVFRHALVGGQYNSTLDAQSVRFTWNDSGNFGGNADGFITMYKLDLNG